MSTHDRVQGALGAWVLGAAGDDARLVEAHLEECGDCQQDAVALSAASDQLVETAPAPVHLWEDISALVEACDRPEPRPASGMHDRYLAEAFQRALLPKRLPDVAGWAIAVAYEPSGDDLLFVREFYECRRTSRWCGRHTRRGCRCTLGRR